MPYDVGSSSYAGQSASQPAAFLDETLVRSLLSSTVSLSSFTNSPCSEFSTLANSIQIQKLNPSFKESHLEVREHPGFKFGTLYCSCSPRELSECLGAIINFPFRILHVQKDLASKKTLTTQIKDNCFLKTQPFDPKLPVHFSHKGLLHHVESKLADGDIRGAARVLFSSDVVAAYSAETVTALQNILENVDKIIRHTLSSILNVALDDRAWQQATFPFAWVGSASAKFQVLAYQHSLIGPQCQPFNGLTDAVEAWKMACPLTDLPVHPSSQRQWDVPLCSI
ncbi:hypothetical protein SFRURICE_006078, partial [Spodoptera frugiperda]